MNETVTGAAPFPNGSYKLIISGVTPPELVQYMNIDIKPGGDEEARINPKAKGNIPVALLSQAATRTSPPSNRSRSSAIASRSLSAARAKRRASCAATRKAWI